MWQKFGFVFLVVVMLVCLPFRAETDTRVLLTVDGRPVSVEEFNGYYSRSALRNRVTADRFFDHFLYFKLKAADARRMGIDTLTEFRLQCSLLQGKALRKYLVEADEESLCFHLCKHFLSDKWVRIEDISAFLPQHSSDKDERDAVRKMDSVYRALQGGEPFGALALKYSRGEAGYFRAGEWLPVSSLLEEFAAVVQGLNPGEYSRPFRSPLGIHIVHLVECREGGNRQAFGCLGESGGSISSFGSKSDLYRKWKNAAGNLPVSVSALLSSVEEELLVIYWDELLGRKTEPEIPEDGLERYFKEHRKDYQWDLPHFKGGVVHCLNKKTASRLKRKLKKVPYSEWEERIRQLSSENPELAAVVETGLFRIGTNAYVDRLAFKCGSFVPLEDFPFTFILGKCLKKGPEDYTDVLERVRNDYREECQEQQLRKLKDRYLVEINKEVLKTVNCSENN